MPRFVKFFSNAARHLALARMIKPARRANQGTIIPIVCSLGTAWQVEREKFTLIELNAILLYLDHFNKESRLYQVMTTKQGKSQNKQSSKPTP
jgi:hypothetical protein